MGASSLLLTAPSSRLQRCCGAVAIGMAALCSLPVASAIAQSSDARIRSAFDEFRLGMLAHDIEPGGNESGVDINVELLSRRPAFAYRGPWADVLFRPRFHIGTSLSMNGNTSQYYAGLTWDVPLRTNWSLELSLGGALHDGPTDNLGKYSFGCSWGFREAVSLGYALSDRWRVYGTVAHMSNAHLCDHNSGLTSAGARLGYTLN